jgi:hypothetical protein
MESLGAGAHSSQRTETEYGVGARIENVTSVPIVVRQDSADRLGGPPFVVVEDPAQPIMVRSG